MSKTNVGPSLSQLHTTGKPVVDKIEKTARAMALADDRDPDQPIKTFEPHAIVGQTLRVFRDAPDLPCWNYYVPLAKLFVAASDVLNGA